MQNLSGHKAFSISKPIPPVPEVIVVGWFTGAAMMTKKLDNIFLALSYNSQFLAYTVIYSTSLTNQPKFYIINFTQNLPLRKKGVRFPISLAPRYTPLSLQVEHRTARPTGNDPSTRRLRGIKRPPRTTPVSAKLNKDARAMPRENQSEIRSLYMRVCAVEQVQVRRCINIYIYSGAGKLKMRAGCAPKVKKKQQNPIIFFVPSASSTLRLYHSGISPLRGSRALSLTHTRSLTFRRRSLVCIKGH